MKEICEIPSCNEKATEHGEYGIPDKTMGPYDYCAEHYKLFDKALKEWIEELQMAHIEIEVEI